MANHGTPRGYATGCRCDRCKAAHSKKMRDYRAKKARERGGNYKPRASARVVTPEPAPHVADTEPPTSEQPRSLGATLDEARRRLWGNPPEPGEAIATDEPDELWRELEATESPDPEPPNATDDKFNKPEDKIFTVSKLVREDIEGKIGFFWGMTASGFQLFDPYCGKVMADRTEIIAAKLTPLVCKSPDLVKWFSSKGGGYMEWLDLAIAVWPVLEAIYAHHLAKTVDKRPDFDATTPPMQPDYSQYAAA